VAPHQQDALTIVNDDRTGAWLRADQPVLEVPAA
jgi:hypothetical protein